MKFFDFSFTFAISFLLADIGIIYWVYTGEFNLWLFVIPVILLIFSLIYLGEYNKKHRDK
ncbi:hypothetical protein [Staphylococcus auricularis]|uniref:Uncharacterized protein n=1 Tax=Staphylococcus auricularis TaxID=29379 RepID=A0ABX5IDU4_9STAP|nr:hypothetical protein [Staphylococcus auricularis]PTH16474.1 hypothetical protein BU607_08475 [Staphylococcus auricularis]